MHIIRTYHRGRGYCAERNYPYTKTVLGFSVLLISRKIIFWVVVVIDVSPVLLTEVLIGHPIIAIV